MRITVDYSYRLSVESGVQRHFMLQRMPGRDYFFDDYFDLFIIESNYKLNWFQLCYDKYEDQHAITWTRGGGILHERVDEGYASNYDQSPVLIRDGHFNNMEIAKRFREASIGIEPWIARTIIEVLEGYDQKNKQERL
jgi:hypothetical protein